MPPAYEILLLNTAIPQIQAAQSGDTYVVPRDIAINATAIISANSATDALRITQTGAGNAILVEDSANPDSTPFVVNASGNVGVGTTSPLTKLNVEGGDILLRGGQLTIGPTAGGNGAGAIRSALNGVLGSLIFQTQDSNAALVDRMTLDSSGNLGLGVTPSLWASGNRFLDVNASASYGAFGSTDAMMLANAFWNGSNWIRKNENNAFRFVMESVNSAPTMNWQVAANGAAGSIISFTQAMTLDASGNLVVGFTSAASILHVRASSATITVDDSGDGTSKISFRPSAASYAERAALSVNYGTTEMRLAAGASGGNFFQTFYTNNTERARITSGGYFKASNDGTYQGITGTFHEVRQSASDIALHIGNTAASAPEGILVRYNAASPNNTSSAFLFCVDSTATRATIRSNGGLANYQANNVDLSDIRTKKEIASAASMWDKVAALEIVEYKYIDQTHDDVNLGVIAQQVETVEPVWVDTDGFGETPEGEEPLKTVYNKDIYFAAIKALQEAMARIEQLEAKVAALEGV